LSDKSPYSYRFDNRDPQQVYAVYASELDCPDGESPVEWMLTTEVIADIQMASTILRWYTYRWRVEEYHKILPGCQVERYRLAADGMKALIGFLSVIAVELLQLISTALNLQPLPLKFLNSGF